MSDEITNKTIETIDLDRDVRIDPAWALRIPAALAMRRLALPLCSFGGEVAVAMADPADGSAIEAIARAAGRPVRVYRAPAEQIKTHLLRVFGDTRKTQQQAQTQPDDPIAQADEILRAAALRNASDIHLDPGRDGLRTRLRVDGILEDLALVPLAQQAALTSRFKIMAGLDIAEKRAPQDGAFNWQASDIRVATMPVKFGEKITLRLLDAAREKLTLDRLGLSDPQRARFERVLARPHGLALITGPTGSGKTTTLYAAIRQLLAGAPLNIITVENPIEYEIRGVAQVEIDTADKVNFTKALRGILRHDPDVVMIGEIRDAESLDTAVKAALTGHLVLSTLHANDAAGAVTRMLDMGLEPHLAAATLRLSAAQRLARRLCPACRRPAELTAEEAAAAGMPELAGRTAYKPVGCLACAGRGYDGRTGLFELMAPDAEIASMIAARATAADIAARLRAKGEPDLRDEAARKILAGETTAAEAARLILDV